MEVIRVAASESVRATERRSTPDARGQQASPLRDPIHTHDICLRSDSHQAVDMLTNGNQDLSSHVTAFLSSRRLIFDVYSSSSSFDEQPRQLHNSGKPAMASISVRNDWAEVVNIWLLSTFGWRHGEAGLTLLPVVEELCLEQMLDLIGDRILHGA